MKNNVCSIPDDIFVYFRADCVTDMVVKGNTEPKIQKEEDSLHASSKLKNLQEFRKLS